MEAQPHAKEYNYSIHILQLNSLICGCILLLSVEFCICIVGSIILHAVCMGEVDIEEERVE